MFSYEWAREKAVLYLADAETPVQLVYEGPFSEGWFFCYQSSEYVETGNLSAQLAGNGPLLVDKFTGELVVLGTNQPVEMSVADYLKDKALRK